MERHCFRAAGATREDQQLTGGFLFGGMQCSKRGRWSTQQSSGRYFAEHSTAFGKEWTEKENDYDAVVAHEQAMARLCDDSRNVFSFPYAIDRATDVTAGTAVHVTAIPNEMAKGVARGWLGADGMSGVTSAWSYFCGDLSTAAMHAEDGDALSVNFNLKGGTKYWIAVWPEDKRLLEQRVKEQMAASVDRNEQRQSAQCGDPLRHKQHYLPMRFLDRIGVRYYVVAQAEGVVVVTLPRSLHQVFQRGSSINVAMNMLCRWWLPFGMTASHVSRELLVPFLPSVLCFAIHSAVVRRGSGRTRASQSRPSQRNGGPICGTR